jgi:DNA topoisomerase-1
MSNKKMFVVESPNKIAKLRKILGSDYIVCASVGHIRGIPAKGMNIDIDNGFEPKFEISRGKGDVVKNLKKIASQVDEVIIATDCDREGEAIAFHIYDVLSKKDQKKCTRVTFQEITKKAVLDSLKDKRPINDNIVNAQKARQVLDRLIGYTISPLLWKKVASKTSAGRVQSVALKIVSDREKEIKAFKPTDFWYIDADLKAKKGELRARVVTKDKDNRYLAQKVVDGDYKKLETASYIISKIERKEKIIGASHPFDTSSLQTTASSLFSWPIKKTASVAQKLYEQGYCTYIRTDSYNIAPEAVQAARDLITSESGSSYLPSKPNFYKKKAKAASQEAHECIRPTDCSNAGGELIGDESRLYKLIRDRFIACQMKPMIVDTVTYHVDASSKHKLIAKGQSVTFDGWSRVYTHTSTKDKFLPPVKESEALDLKELIKTKGQTKPPPRYNEGSLVKKMEDEGVGRPSTYPSIMENIQKREYVKKKDKKGTLEATELGIRVSDYLDEQFKDFIMDVKYTALLESHLDVIEDGTKTYLEVVQDTYDLMMERVRKARGTTAKVVGSSKCTVCKQGAVVEKGGKFGVFYACDRYPDCKTIFDLSEDGKLSPKAPKVIDKSKECPECKKAGRKGYLQKRKNRKDNSFFFGCNKYPKCKHTESDVLGGID